MVNIEAGKYYRNRRGSKVGPILATKNTDFPFRIAGINGGTFYTADGRFDLRKPSVVDLVSEWDEPTSATVPIDGPDDTITSIKIVRQVPPLTIIGVDVQRDGNHTADAAVMTNAAAAAQEASILPAPDEAPADQAIAKLAQAARSTSHSVADIVGASTAATKPRGRKKGTVNKVKAVKEYAQVKKEIAKKFDKPVRTPKVEKTAKTAEIKAAVIGEKLKVETAEASADELVMNLTETIEQLARRAALRRRIDRTEAKFLGAVIYTATAIIFLRD